ncbi:MAG: gamma carbonic anhydrase family protein [Hyphomicrobiales bacterium]|nr:MAG: gamma carbonic anhydrase family protein [Hyphomicrobiales bacterium]
MTLYSLGELTPQLPEEGAYWTAPNASLIGNIRLERNASVWFGAVLRGDIEQILIGPDSNVQDNCVCHTDRNFPLTLGAGCTVGHNAVLHGCTVGDNSLIGIGATVLNGAVIGNNCVIGAHALIPEGREIPDNSLVVGMPGRVVRQLKDEDIEHLRWSAAHYVRQWRKYAENMKQG